MAKKKNNKAIKSALAALEKRFGEPVVLKMNDAHTGIDTFSSGRPKLDIALGGGYAVGKIVEIFAESGAGKTGLALEAIKQVQDIGGIAAIIDAEHALNTEYCEDIGINVDDLYISQPSDAEQAFEAMRALIGTGQFELIVVDSVAAMVPRAELAGESGEAKIALQARIMSQGMKLISGVASEIGCTIIFINQLRASISQYGPPTITSGGKALPFYATQRLEVKRKGFIKEGEDAIGFHQFIKVVKNKVSAPFKTCEHDIIYGKGIDHITGLIEACVEANVLQKSGAFYKYYGETIAQGIKKLRVIMEDNQEFVEELQKKLKGV